MIGSVWLTCVRSYPSKYISLILPLLAPLLGTPTVLFIALPFTDSEVRPNRGSNPIHSTLFGKVKEYL